MAEFVKEKLDPDLAIYLEHSNEVWNSVFPGQFQYALQKAKDLGLLKGGSDFDGLVNYHAQRSAEIVKIWHEVFNDRERLIGVFGVGGPKSWMIGKGMGHLRSIGMDSWIDVAAIAPYVGAGKSFSSVDGAIQVLRDGLPGFKNDVAECKKAADDNGLRLIAYEGGSHLWNFGQDFSHIAEEAQGDPRMRQWVLDYMNAWKENGGDEFMVFTSGGGFWGQIPWGVDPSDAPKYQGHLDFIKQNPVWWDVPWNPDATTAKMNGHGVLSAELEPYMAHDLPVMIYDMRGRRLVWNSRRFHALQAPGVYLTPLPVAGQVFRKNLKMNRK
jgi:hypothetical protein